VSADVGDGITLPPVVSVSALVVKVVDVAVSPRSLIVLGAKAMATRLVGAVDN
jgi:hypothetical protein